MKTNATQLIKVLVSELQNYEQIVEKQGRIQKEFQTSIDEKYNRKLEVNTNELERLIKNEQASRSEDYQKMNLQIKKLNNGVFYSFLVFIFSIAILIFSYNYKNDKINELNVQNQGFIKFLSENPKNNEAYKTWISQKTKEDTNNEKSN